MPKAMVAMLLKMDPENVGQGLQLAAGNLATADGEMVLDFSSVTRINSTDLREIENLVGLADDKAIKVGLRGVTIDVYKVLKLMKLVPRFSFLT
jgi:anti-anti-sigma regulatory factor